MQFVGLLLQLSQLFGLDGEIATEFCDLSLYAVGPIDRCLSSLTPSLSAADDSRLLHALRLMKAARTSQRAL